MDIEDLRADDLDACEQTAALLVEAFRGHSPAWPDLDSAREEVAESLAAGRLSRIARADDGAVLGWIGGISEYDGHAWELHPLCVDPRRQRQGIGRTLVADLERLVAERGATTLWLGTDDEDGRTSLSGVDLYPNPLEQLARITNPGGHPYEFYLRCGFALVGVLPDANGPGKPDIYMAKRVRREA